ncbi:hypothetical protein Agub_g6386 [Astrephomene gubernaculifera]|uniref:DUF1764-domain-containing protein n=1 Tax=Astrephomene gubernaculifera TaxID=47775 RepID=A0AAD3DRB7_9CHLO|nr:hypothetical protein Agub_g6386 [Astrephomene gubernaculifera]
MGKQQTTGKPLTKDAAAQKASKDVKKDKEAKVSAALEENPKAKTDGGKDGGIKQAKVKKSEIDDIFSAGKKKAQESAAEKRAAEDAEPKDDAPSKKPRVEGSKDDIFGEATGKGRKRTEEGYAIYSEEELGLAKKGGDTDLCPFDCDCCY